MVLARLEGRFAADAAIGAADEGDRHGSAHYSRYRVWGRNCIGMMVLVAAASAGLAPAASAAARFVPGEALVRYEAGATPAERAAARDGAAVTLEDVLGLPRTQLVSFDGSVGSAVTRLERSPVVLDAQPNYRYRANAPVPDDTFFGQQWGLGVAPGVDVLPAWDRTRGGGQVIAVVDTGVDLTHPDLTESLWINPGETAANGLDDDGNGKVDDVHGYDFVDADADPDDFQFHGTHVAGIATAAAANAEGTAGVAPEADLMAVRALDGNGFGDTADIAEAVRYSAQEGAGVINLSLGGPAGGPSDAVFLQAVQVAEAADAVVVVAAGNAGSNNDGEPTVPCNFPSPNLICVAALDSSGALAGYSNYGLTTVNVGAPGSAILSSKTDWAAPLFTENFEAGLAEWTSFPGTSAWAEVTPGAGGTGKAASDSPGGPYAATADASLTKSSPLLLDGRGCRMHFDLKSDVHASDELVAGAVTDDFDVFDGLFIEDNFVAFDTAEVSISRLDGRADVYPTFELFADASGQGDGASVDNVRVLCRDETYLNSIVGANNYAAANGGSYMRISGTSMATPHVSGVAALVRAAAPNADADQVISAIEQGGRSSAALLGRTSTGKLVDALGAITAAVATGTPPVTSTQPPVTGGSQPPEPTPTRPGPAGVAGRFRVDRRGRITIRIAGDPGVRGTFRLRAGSPRRLVLRTSFRTSARGVAVMRERLNRVGRRLLRRRGGRVRAGVRVVLTNSAGLRSVTTQNPVVLAMRR